MPFRHQWRNRGPRQSKVGRQDEVTAPSYVQSRPCGQMGREDAGIVAGLITGVMLRCELLIRKAQSTCALRGLARVKETDKIILAVNLNTSRLCKMQM